MSKRPFLTSVGKGLRRLGERVRAALVHALISRMRGRWCAADRLIFDNDTLVCVRGTAVTGLPWYLR